MKKLQTVYAATKYELIIGKLKRHANHGFSIIEVSKERKVVVAQSSIYYSLEEATKAYIAVNR